MEVVGGFSRNNIYLLMCVHQLKVIFKTDFLNILQVAVFKKNWEVFFLQCLTMHHAKFEIDRTILTCLN